MNNVHPTSFEANPKKLIVNIINYNYNMNNYKISTIN